MRQAPSRRSHGSETVLLVEDDEQARAVVRRILKSRGYQVIEAKDGGAALAAWERDPEGIDLVVTDLVIPGFDGVTIASELQTRTPRSPGGSIEASTTFESNLLDHSAAAFRIVEITRVGAQVERRYWVRDPTRAGGAGSWAARRRAHAARRPTDRAPTMIGLNSQSDRILPTGQWQCDSRSALLRRRSRR
jgi:CheY-like chemotaxis protein